MIGDGLEKGFVSWWFGVRKNLEYHAGFTATSFSKCFSMHEICLKLFLHHYNTELLPSIGYDSI